MKNYFYEDPEIEMNSEATTDCWLVQDVPSAGIIPAAPQPNITININAPIYISVPNSVRFPAAFADEGDEIYECPFSDCCEDCDLEDCEW